MRRRRGHDGGVTLAEQVLLLVTLGLVGFGVVMVYSASSGLALSDYGDSLFFLKREAVYAAVGLLALVGCSRIDPRVLGRLSPVLLGVSAVLLVLVMVAGYSVKGAQRWLALGPLSMQPSELAKLSVLLYAAWMLASRPAPRDWREAMRPVGTVAAAFCALLLLQKDLGSALGLAVGAAAVLVVSGTRAGALARLGGVALGLVAMAIYSETYRRQRLLAFMNPWADPNDSGYQLVQSQLAFGSGGVFGVGLGESIEKVQRLPEAHTDMIFAIIGEELGLIGVACVLAAFAALAWAGFSIALAAKDPFGKRIAAGVTALIVGQAAINFGGVLSIVPLTGVPLPLISYGGSSLITTLAGIGVVLAVAAREREPQTARRPQAVGAVEAVAPPLANVHRLERPAGRPQRRTRRTAARR